MEKEKVPLKVDARDRENIEVLLRRFKRLLKKDGRIMEIRKWDYYVKPSEKKKLKKRRKKFTDGSNIQ